MTEINSRLVGRSVSGTLQTIAEAIVSFFFMIIVIIFSGSVFLGIAFLILLLIAWHYYDKSKDLEKKLALNERTTESKAES